MLKWKRLSLKLENRTEGWIKVIKHEWPKNLWTEDQPEKISLYAAQSDNAVEKNEREVETWRLKWESINNPIRGIPEGGEMRKRYNIQRKDGREFSRIWERHMSYKWKSQCFIRKHFE